MSEFPELMVVPLDGPPYEHEVRYALWSLPGDNRVFAFERPVPPALRTFIEGELRRIVVDHWEREYGAPTLRWQSNDRLAILP